MDKQTNATAVIKHIRINSADQKIIDNIKNNFGFVSESDAIRMAIRNFQGVVK